MQYLTCQAGDVSAERIVASALPPARHLLYGPACGFIPASQELGCFPELVAPKRESGASACCGLRSP